MVSIKLEGDDELIAALNRLGDQIPQEVDDVVNATGLEIQGDIKRRIQRGPATGRTYRKGSGGRFHTASAPGEAPATDTGRLVNSIAFNKLGAGAVEVASLLRYAPMLEFGTFKMAPRPSWVPAVEKARPKYQKRMETALARILK